MHLKIKNVFDCIKNAKADALVSLSPINRKWLLGRAVADFALILYHKNEVHIFVDARDISTIKKIGKPITPHLYKEVNDWFSFCKKLNLKNILFESNQVSFDEYQKYIKPLKVKLIAINGNDLRIYKTLDEIKYIKKACQIICKAINHIKKWIKVGMTEIDVANEIYRFVIKNGASSVSFETIVGFGANSADIHGIPSMRKLKKDDLILIDAGCVYQGYCSDITRVFSLGNLSPKLQKMYDVVLKANQLGIQKIKSGMTGIQVDKVCRDYIKQHWSGYDFPHGTGHGVGMLIHELPMNNKIYDKVIPINAVVTIEPGIYEENLGGIRIEDTIVITKNGCEVLTKSVSK